jgi:hypothetical protein
MNLFEYALRAYNLLLDLVLLILNPFVGPLRYLLGAALAVIVALSAAVYLLARKRRGLRR